MAFRDGILVFRQAGALPKDALQSLVDQVGTLDMDAVRAQLAESKDAAAEPADAAARTPLTGIPPSHGTHHENGPATARWPGRCRLTARRDVPPAPHGRRRVEVAGIEPASDDMRPGLLRAQCAMDFLGPRARTHTFPDRPSRVRVPRSPSA